MDSTFAATATLGTTATQADFIDDSNVQLKFKNFYLDRQIEDNPAGNFGFMVTSSHLGC